MRGLFILSFSKFSYMGESIKPPYIFFSSLQMYRDREDRTASYIMLWCVVLPICCRGHVNIGGGCVISPCKPCVKDLSIWALSGTPVWYIFHLFNPLFLYISVPAYDECAFCTFFFFRLFFSSCKRPGFEPLFSLTTPFVSPESQKLCHTVGREAVWNPAK